MNDEQRKKAAKLLRLALGGTTDGESLAALRALQKYDPNELAAMVADGAAPAQTVVVTVREDPDRACEIVRSIVADVEESLMPDPLGDMAAGDLAAMVHELGEAIVRTLRGEHPALVTVTLLAATVADQLRRAEHPKQLQLRDRLDQLFAADPVQTGGADAIARVSVRSIVYHEPLGTRALL